MFFRPQLAFNPQVDASHKPVYRACKPYALNCEPGSSNLPVPATTREPIHTNWQLPTASSCPQLASCLGCIYFHLYLPALSLVSLFPTLHICSWENLLPTPSSIQLFNRHSLFIILLIFDTLQCPSGYDPYSPFQKNQQTNQQHLLHPQLQSPMVLANENEWETSWPVTGAGNARRVATEDDPSAKLALGEVKRRHVPTKSPVITFPQKLWAIHWNY